jgi:hypothetical protein
MDRVLMIWFWTRFWALSQALLKRGFLYMGPLAFMLSWDSCGSKHEILTHRGGCRHIEDRDRLILGNPVCVSTLLLWLS